MILQKMDLESLLIFKRAQVIEFHAAFFFLINIFMSYCICCGWVAFEAKNVSSAFKASGGWPNHLMPQSLDPINYQQQHAPW